MNQPLNCPHCDGFGDSIQLEDDDEPNHYFCRVCQRRYAIVDITDYPPEPEQLAKALQR